MKKKTLSKSEIKQLDEEIAWLTLSKKDNVALVDDTFLYVNNELVLYYQDDLKIPVLKYLLKHEVSIPKITVDMGAVKFVCNGADIMRPGITKVEHFEKNALVVIVDETHGKPLAICQTLLSSEEMEKQESGKSLKNLHYVGDEIWNKQVL